jgi:hypothetical protein
VVDAKTVSKNGAVLVDLVAFTDLEPKESLGFR